MAGLAWLIVDVLALRGHLQATGDELLAAKAAILEADVPGATEHVTSARAEVDAATGRIDGPVWWLLRITPLVADTPEVLDAAVQLADASVAVAQAALTSDTELLPTDGTIPLSFDDGRVDLELLAEYRSLLDGLPIEAVRVARDRLALASDGTIAGVLRNAADEAVATADELLETLAAGQDGLALAQGLLGAEGPRSVLIAIQNPSELRGAGGLVGFLAVLDVESGRISLAPPVDVESGALPEETKENSGGAAGIEGPGVVFHNDLQGREATEPVDRPAEIAARYDHNKIGVELESVTVHPDVAVVGPIMTALYERLTGVSTDALVLVTPVGLQRLQEHVGPLELPPELAKYVPTMPNPVPADQLTEVLLITAYDELGGPTRLRRQYQAVLANRAFSAFLDGGWEAAEVARSLGESLASRHVQLWSGRPDEQERLERLGVAGRLRDGDPFTDDVLITANNSAANKADSFALHRFDLDVQLSHPIQSWVRRHIVATITQANTFEPDEVHDGFIQNAVFRDGQGGLRRDERTGLMRTWWTWWIENKEGVDTYWRGSPDNERGYDRETVNGLFAIDGTILLERGEHRSLGLGYHRDILLEEDRDEVVYRLRWRRQPKVVHDILNIRLRPPPGWTVVAAVASGGPAQPTLDGLAHRAPVARVIDNEVTMTGTVTSDVVLEVRMVRG
ncbi:MAG: DUF4012 domain-containing protein [Nitriliruptorales bacterium]|nr:DUF4012 domain-containing protein [Nitriliruptorales bacterium]